MQLAVVVLATCTVILAWRWTVAAAELDEARERVGVLERLLRMRGRSVRALADMLAGR